jgi:hypothetical protein
MLRCRIKAGTPSNPNTPVLIANPTGKWAKPDRSSPRIQYETSNPGAMKRTSVAAKAMGGKASEMFPKGRRRIVATAQESNTSASGNLGRAGPPTRPAGECVFTGLSRKLQMFPSAKASTIF